MARKTRYTPTPAVPKSELERLTAIVAVLSGLKTVTDAARSVGLSRPHFQALLHRGIEGLVQGIRPRRSGRNAKPAAVTTLERENKKLKRANARLTRRVESTEKLLTVAGGLLQGRIRPTRKRSARTGARDESPEGDPDPAIQQALSGIDSMRALGVTASVAATVAGVHPATVRRWRVRHLRPVPSAATVPSPAVASRAAELVRALKGQVGADALRHSVPGLSRRQAAWVKGQVMTAMERERKATLTRVQVTIPGVVRGMDGVHYRDAEGVLWALIAADGAVPYRTSVTAGHRYDATLVATALAADIARHGAPIVYRLDRARAHDAPVVREVLEGHHVLVLHGPPHCPWYYGQLERQNREHRGWAEELRELPQDEAETCLLAMLERVNTLWRRRMLGWRTAAEVWAERPVIAVDRLALRDEVKDNAARIARSLSGRSDAVDLAERLAIEQALERRGYLTKQPGGWC